MYAGYHTGKFTTLIVILFLFLIFGLVASAMFEAPVKKGAGKASAPAPSVDPGIFSRTGFIVETAVGRAILYEEPGRPAIRKDLVLDAKSRCDLGDGYTPCSLQSLFSGLRVKVSGFPSGESAVFVSKIEVAH